MPRSRSLRDSISMGIGDAIDSVKGTYDRARSRDAARNTEVAAPSRPTNRYTSDASSEMGGTLRGMAPRALRERKAKIEKDLEDAGA